jgi:thiamine kinase-like enzyme
MDAERIAAELWPGLRIDVEPLGGFHEGRAIPGRFDAFRVVEVYRDTAEANGVRVPAAYEWAHERARAIEGARGPQPLHPCHNDLLNANFIDDGAALRIVDWEYAGMGDVFFDLANFSVNHELDDAQNRILLAEYFREPRSSDLAALNLMRFMSDFREAMWGVVQQGISELDFDFEAYAAEHFARLRRTAAEPRFEDALSGG